MSGAPYRIGAAYHAMLRDDGRELALFFACGGARLGITELDRRAADALRDLAAAIDAAQRRRQRPTRAALLEAGRHLLAAERAVQDEIGPETATELARVRHLLDTWTGPGGWLDHAETRRGN